MEPTAYEIAVIGGGFAIVGALIGTWSGYRLTLSLSQFTAKRDAATKFRAAFRDELLALNPALTMNAPDTCDLLTTAFEKHRVAIFDFKPFLSTADAERLEKAWQDYYRYPDAPDFTVPVLEQYSSKGCSISEARRRRELAAGKIETILSSAQHK